MTGYDPAEFEARAIGGNGMPQSVLSRAAIKPEVLQRLMVPEAHDEVLLALATHQDVTPEQLDWIAEHTEDTYVLNRTAAHGRTSTSTIRNIRSKALEQLVNDGQCHDSGDGTGDSQNDWCISLRACVPIPYVAGGSRGRTTVSSLIVLCAGFRSHTNREGQCPRSRGS